MSHNNQKKIAVINDISGFGRCSIAVSLPIISMLKVQCCPLPTSIFSNHTGFDSFFYEDFTPYMERYINEWEKLNLNFSGICTGFLGSAEQINIVTKFFQKFITKDTIVVIDPVMGDYGKAYPTYTEEMCQNMKNLIQYANILTPNLTESCILTDIPYKEDWTFDEVTEIARILSSKGPSKIVITGIIEGNNICNLCYEGDDNISIIKTKKIGTPRSGTGDIFSAIVAADAVNQVSLKESVQKAADFIKECILKSIEMDIPLTDGVCFEEVLHTLK